MLVKGATGDKALYHPLFLTSLEENIYSHYYHHVTRMMLWATNKCFQRTYAVFRVFRVLDESGVSTETRMVTHRVLTGLVTPAIVISTLVDIWGNRDYRDSMLRHGYTRKGRSQSHVWILSVFSEVWSHPPLSSAHSSIFEGIQITDSRLGHGYTIGLWSGFCQGVNYMCFIEK